MIKPLIFLRKNLITKPKWKILRIYTKQIKKQKLVQLLDALTNERAQADDSHYKEYLRGKIEILNTLLE